MRTKRGRQSLAVGDKRKLKKGKPSKFDATKFINELFARERFNIDRNFEMTLSVTRNIARMIANSAFRIGVTDHEEIAQLIVMIAINDEYSEQSLQQISDLFASIYANHFVYHNHSFQHLLEQIDLDDLLVCLSHFKDDLGVKKQFLAVLDLFRGGSIEGVTADPSLLVDCLRMTSFFSHQAIVENYFDKLENQLQYYVAQSDDFLKDKLVLRHDGKYTIPLAAPMIFRSHKILSSVLKQWSRQNGFNAYVYVIGRLEETKMATILQSQGFFKDVYNQVGGYHGAWSHALQWYLIIEHHKQTNFLVNAPMDLYKKFAELWRVVIDKYNGNGYYSPEFITGKMIEPAAAERWPILSGTITRHHAKMHSPNFQYLDKFQRKGIHETFYVKEHFNFTM